MHIMYVSAFTHLCFSLKTNNNNGLKILTQNKMYYLFRPKKKKKISINQMCEVSKFILNKKK